MPLNGYGMSKRGESSAKAGVWLPFLESCQRGTCPQQGPRGIFGIFTWDDRVMQEQNDKMLCKKIIKID